MTYQGKWMRPRSFPESAPCKITGHGLQGADMSGRGAGQGARMPRTLPAGAVSLVQGDTGGHARAPDAVGVPGEHAVLAGAMLPAEGHRGLHHARVGAGIDKLPALWV